MSDHNIVALKLHVTMVTRQNLINTYFLQMFGRDQQLIDISSHFNVFGLDKMRF